MEIGKDVVLQKFSGDKVEEFDGIVIGVNRDSLNIAYFDQSKAAFLGGVDWRLAFERINDVKESAHEDVQAGKEGFAYRLDAEDAVAEDHHQVPDDVIYVDGVPDHLEPHVEVKAEEVAPEAPAKAEKKK